MMRDQKKHSLPNRSVALSASERIFLLLVFFAASIVSCGDSGRLSGAGPEDTLTEVILPDEGTGDPPIIDPIQDDEEQDPDETPRNPDPDDQPATLCDAEPPAGAVQAAPIPSYSGGTCPGLGVGRNTIWSGDSMREFLLVVPKNVELDQTDARGFSLALVYGERQRVLPRK